MSILLISSVHVYVRLALSLTVFCFPLRWTAFAIASWDAVRAHSLILSDHLLFSSQIDGVGNIILGCSLHFAYFLIHSYRYLFPLSDGWRLQQRLGMQSMLLTHSLRQSFVSLSDGRRLK